MARFSGKKWEAHLPGATGITGRAKISGIVWLGKEIKKQSHRNPAGKVFHLQLKKGFLINDSMQL